MRQGLELRRPWWGNLSAGDVQQVFGPGARRSGWGLSLRPCGWICLLSCQGRWEWWTCLVVACYSKADGPQVSRLALWVTRVAKEYPLLGQYSEDIPMARVRV